MIYAESAPKLASLCPRPALVCDEDLLPFKDESLNLVVSGPRAASRQRSSGRPHPDPQALAPDGLFLGAALGSRSLHELRRALIEAEVEEQGGASPHIAPFADLRDYGALLQRAGFALPVTDAELLTLIYPSPRDLMAEIRVLGGGQCAHQPPQGADGARHARARREPLSLPPWHADGQIVASFEIVYLAGWAPHASQQKPLAPGSAQTRLSDALRTVEHPAGDKAAFPAKTKPEPRT